jgi:hypothetical protein
LRRVETRSTDCATPPCTAKLRQSVVLNSVH